MHLPVLNKSLCQNINPQYSKDRKISVMGGELYTTQNVQTLGSMDSDFQFLC